jgi:hypothetical protein
MLILNFLIEVYNSFNYLLSKTLERLLIIEKCSYAAFTFSYISLSKQNAYMKISFRREVLIGSFNISGMNVTKDNPDFFSTATKFFLADFFLGGWV